MTGDQIQNWIRRGVLMSHCAKLGQCDRNEKKQQVCSISNLVLNIIKQIKRMWFFLDVSFKSNG